MKGSKTRDALGDSLSFLEEADAVLYKRPPPRVREQQRGRDQSRHATPPATLRRRAHLDADDSVFHDFSTREKSSSPFSREIPVTRALRLAQEERTVVVVLESAIRKTCVWEPRRNRARVGASRFTAAPLVFGLVASSRSDASGPACLRYGDAFTITIRRGSSKRGEVYCLDDYSAIGEEEEEDIVARDGRAWREDDVEEEEGEEEEERYLTAEGEFSSSKYTSWTVLPDATAAMTGLAKREFGDPVEPGDEIALRLNTASEFATVAGVEEEGWYLGVGVGTSDRDPSRVACFYEPYPWRIMALDEVWVRPSGRTLDDPRRAAEQQHDARTERLARVEEPELVKILIYALLGVLEGLVVRRANVLEIADDTLLADPRLARQSTRVLEIASRVELLREWMRDNEGGENGRINQTVAREFAVLMDSFETRVADLLRAPTLSLSRLTIEVSSLSEQLVRWVGALSLKWHARGGALVEALARGAEDGGTTTTSNGEEESRSLPSHSRRGDPLRAACEAYLEMVNEWMTGGRLDPRDEKDFFVRRTTKVSGRGKILSHHFIITRGRREARNGEEVDEEGNVIPSFLAPHAEAILATGRDAFLLCTLSRTPSTLAPRPPTPPLPQYLGRNPAAYEGRITAARRETADALLNFLRSPPISMDRVISGLREAFLLTDGAFASHFMEIAAKELEASPARASTSRLLTALRVAMRANPRCFPEIQDDLFCWLCTRPLEALSVTSRGPTEATPARRSSRPRDGDEVKSPIMNTANALVLDYRCSRAVSCVVTKRALSKFQLLFRHLFRVRLVERRLTEEARPMLDKTDPSSTLFCFRAAQFLQALQYYLSHEVIEAIFPAPPAQGFTHGIPTVEDAARALEAKLDAVARGCLLCDARAFGALSALLACCLEFADEATRGSRILPSIDRFEVLIRNFIESLLLVGSAPSSVVSGVLDTHQLFRKLAVHVDLNGFYLPSSGKILGGDERDDGEEEEDSEEEENLLEVKRGNNKYYDGVIFVSGN